MDRVKFHFLKWFVKALEVRPLKQAETNLVISSYSEAPRGGGTKGAKANASKSKQMQINVDKRKQMQRWKC